jgi:hypothetical protein
METKLKDLLARAKERAESSPTPIPDEWGYRLALDEGEYFNGRWRGETVDEENNNRRVFLLWDQEGQRCFSRFYVALAREIDRVKPEIGATIVIYRGDDYLGQHGPGYSFGVETEANRAPLPGAEDEFVDDIGF